jgi:hypothetical protein
VRDLDRKTLEAIKAGVLSGTTIAVIFGLPLLAVLGPAAVTRSSGRVTDILYLLTGTMFQCLCVAPFISAIIALVSSAAALRWSRGTLASLNEAVRVSLLASALTAGIGSILPVALFDLLAAYSIYVSNVHGYSLIFGALGLLVYGSLSFFGGLMYGVYALDLRYAHEAGER